MGAHRSVVPSPSDPRCPLRRLRSLCRCLIHGLFCVRQVAFAEDDVPKSLAKQREEAAEKAEAGVVFYPTANGCAPSRSPLFQSRAQRDKTCQRLRTLTCGARVSLCLRAKDHAGLCNARKPCEAEWKAHNQMYLGCRPYTRIEEEPEIEQRASSKGTFADKAAKMKTVWVAPRVPTPEPEHTYASCANYSPTSPCFGPCECCATPLPTPVKKAPPTPFQSEDGSEADSESSDSEAEDPGCVYHPEGTDAKIWSQLQGLEKVELGEKRCGFCAFSVATIKKDSYGRMACTSCGDTHSCEACGVEIKERGATFCPDCSSPAQEEASDSDAFEQFLDKIGLPDIVPDSVVQDTLKVLIGAGFTTEELLKQMFDSHLDPPTSGFAKTLSALGVRSIVCTCMFAYFWDTSANPSAKTSAAAAELNARELSNGSEDEDEDEDEDEACPGYDLAQILALDRRSSKGVVTPFQAAATAELKARALSKKRKTTKCECECGDSVDEDGEDRCNNCIAVQVTWDGLEAEEAKKIAGRAFQSPAKKAKVVSEVLPEVASFLRDRVGISDEASIKTTTGSLIKCTPSAPWDVDAIQDSFDAFGPAEFVKFLAEWTKVLSIPAPVAIKMWEYFSCKKIAGQQLASTNESTSAEIASRVQTEMAEAMRIARAASPRCTFCEIPELTNICNDDRGRMSCTRCGETHTCSCGGLVTVRGQNSCEDCNQRGERVARELSNGSEGSDRFPIVVEDKVGIATHFAGC